MRSTLMALVTAGLVALAPAAARAAESGVKLDIKKAVPEDAFLAVYGKHNPERDYQAEYCKEAWNTFREERIGERVFEIIKSQAPKEDLEKMQNAWEEVQEALEPINLEALSDSQEVVVAEALEGHVNQVLIVVRLTPEDAGDYKQGIGQLFELVSKWSHGKVKAETDSVDDADVTKLALPKESPIQPAVGQIDDLFLISTSEKLLRESIGQLRDDSAKSKFDDPRLAEALEHLPEPEDTLVFFDGTRLFEGMRGIGGFIRAEASKEADSDEKREMAERVAKVFDKVIDECAIFDYSVVVEYTEDGQNRLAELGKLSPGYEDKLLGKALGQGEAFEDWKSWVPADATSYSLTTGVNLHVLYEGIMDLVKKDFPEAKPGLDKFEEVQEQVGVHLDRDILQSFSGESVSLAFPAEGNSDKQETVAALRCTNPERIKELIERGVSNLKKFPALEQQGIELEEADEPEGFTEVRANIFQMVGANPVFGFEDDWMIIASSSAAAQKFLDVRAGDAESIADAESFTQFDLEVGDEVYGVRYSDIGGGIRAAADMIDQIAATAPMFVMMAAAEAKPEELKAINDAIGLLPSIAKVVRKFDFFEQQLSVTREGPLPDSYIRETVTKIRQPESEDAGN